MMTLLFLLFGGLAIGCAVAMVAHRNPLYSAISLIGVFLSLACLYLMLQAPFIAAVQVIVYAGAIMVLVVFVIMLLNVEEEARRPLSLRYLVPIGVGLAAVLTAEAAFILKLPGASRVDMLGPQPSDVGLTHSIGTGLFTEYLLPFEVTSVLILMALVGAITLARRTTMPLHGTDAAADFQPTSPAPPDAVIKPGDTQATGQAYAKMQIERDEAALHASGDKEEGAR